MSATVSAASCTRPPMSEQTAQEGQNDGDGTAGSLLLPAVAMSGFPASFLHWLSVHGISAQLYSLSQSLPRYVRINPRSNLQPSSLACQLGTPLHPTAIPQFFRLSSDARLAFCSAYMQGECYGMDLASAVAVRALDLQAEHCTDESDCVHVLDLCAAPGAKLAYLHDLLSCSPSARPFSLTGVDISLQRLSSCRNLLKKYSIGNTRLCLADGRSFSAPPPPPNTLLPRCIAVQHAPVCVLSSCPSTTCSPTLSIRAFTPTRGSSAPSDAGSAEARSHQQRPTPPSSPPARCLSLSPRARVHLLPLLLLNITAC